MDDESTKKCPRCGNNMAYESFGWHCSRCSRGDSMG